MRACIVDYVSDYSPPTAHRSTRDTEVRHRDREDATPAPYVAAAQSPPNARRHTYDRIDRHSQHVVRPTAHDDADNATDYDTRAPSGLPVDVPGLIVKEVRTDSRLPRTTPHTNRDPGTHATTRSHIALTYEPEPLTRVSPLTESPSEKTSCDPAALPFRQASFDLDELSLPGPRSSSRATSTR
ncbi:hypothetical protein EKO27_g6288 [Xylaria grammica]|uniref:Uncharacterized protein n=1 Tax=Xylaria grammica TaxID=363999 RepID=A0A439D316_9PEZI|nr:hypothetical protein EKO27_g6288 [Xylaria grammica]